MLHFATFATHPSPHRDRIPAPAAQPGPAPSAAPDPAADDLRRLADALVGLLAAWWRRKAAGSWDAPHDEATADGGR